MDQLWEGRVVYAKYFPFAMRPWEAKIYRRHFPLQHFSADSIEVANGQPVSEWKDTSAAFNEEFLPRWFNAWLSLRTAWAKLKQYGK